jgi:hypothetical protein
MAHILLLNPGTPVTKADIAEAESQIGINFPDSIREFYLSWNGGRPNPNLFPKDGDSYVIHQFLPVKYPNPRITVESTYLDLTSDPATEKFPRHLVPIAIDGGGDHYCFSARQSDFGCIYCFCWDYYGDAARSIAFLAASLDSLLESLT